MIRWNWKGRHWGSYDWLHRRKFPLFYIIFVVQTTTTTQQSLSSPAGTTISHESINVNLEEFQHIVDGLKVGRNNTSAYRRRITCAYDPRKSSMAIGSLGALFISGVIGLIVLADCLTIMKTWDWVTESQYQWETLWFQTFMNEQSTCN